MHYHTGKKSHIRRPKIEEILRSNGNPATFIADDHRTPLGTQLKMLRKSILTVEQLSELSGISERVIREIESGKRVHWHSRTLWKIVHAMGGHMIIRVTLVSLPRRVAGRATEYVVPIAPIPKGKTLEEVQGRALSPARYAQSFRARKQHPQRRKETSSATGTDSQE